MIVLPTIRQLQHLVALADHLHFGRAARACRVTQSTLSASLKSLENALQAALVDRTRRQVTLTPLGHEVVERARRVLRETEDLARLAEASREPLTGTLRLGVIPTISPFLLPRILPGLRRAYPRLKLFLTEDLTARLVDALETGQVDAILIALPYDGLGNVDVETLFEDRFAATMPRDHPLADRDKLTPRDLAEASLLLLQDGHCLREHALSACRLGGRSHEEAFEATSLTTLVQMVDNGLGLTLLPDLAIAGGILRGTRLVTRPIAGAPGRTIALAWRRGTARRDEFRLFARELATRATA